MITAGSAVLAAVLATQSPAADSLRVLATRLSEAALVTETRARPLAVREAVSQALAKNQLDAARNLAAAYALAWSDSFVVREVARFSAWPLERRAAKVWADSVRRAGIATYSRDGPRAAIATWRRALFVAAGIPDTAGIAAVLGNIGAAFVADGQPDSGESSLARSQALATTIGDVRVQANDRIALAGLSEDRGDLAVAREHYRRALALQERIGDSRGMAAAYNNLGLLAQDVGDLDEARRQFAAALELNRRDGRDEVAATNLVNLAGLASLGGDFAQAERMYRDALATWRSRGEWADAASALHGLGQLEIRRGDYPAAQLTLAEAVRRYARAEFLYREAGDVGGEAEAQQGRGLLFLARENYPRAQALLETALRTETGAGRARAAALTRVTLGLVSLKRGDTTAARRQLVRAATDLDQLGDPVGAAAATAERAALEAAAGFASVAESLYRVGLDRLGNRGVPEVAWRLHAGLGLVLRTRGALDDAAREFRTALTHIDRSARSLVLAERRSAYLADKWDVYAQLALTERSRGLPGAAFDASERLRAREMLELLARGRVETAGDTAADLVEREQDLRWRIAELERPVEGSTRTTEELRGPDPSLPGEARLAALSHAQDAYGELLLEMRERSPRHADLVARGAVSWRDVAPRLASDEAFVEYLVSDSGSLAFVVTRDTLTVVSLGIAHRELARLVKLARGAMEPLPSTEKEALWRGPLRRLHESLIAPIEEAGLLSGKTRLVIVPHAELHYLPFAALVEGDGRFLVERYEIVLTPSASVWLALGDRRPERAVTGILAFAPRPDALPASGREAGAIARLAGADVLSGAAATEAEFRREAPTRRVLHLATYGVLNKQNPLFSFVELAPGEGQDGRLEVHEVFGLHLSADLVVLSACQTGLASGALADVPPGDDWVGLTRAFLHAGARRVVATLWLVDDWATAALMERFYEGYVGGAEPAQALAAAQRVLIAQPATAHPFYWAGFVAVGGARGEARP
jgi:CHAT domain-containing protein